MVLHDDPQSIKLIDNIVRLALTGVFEDLNRFNWYIREREIVNLFAFGHMVPLFQQHGLDLTMMAIEYPVLQMAMSESSRHGAYKDFVIWPEPYLTFWKGCELSCGMDFKQLRGPGKKPFAVVEWKNISSITNPKGISRLQRQHAADKNWLRRNRNDGMLTVGYAILTTRAAGRLSLRCHRVSRDSEREFLSLPAALVKDME